MTALPFQATTASGVIFDISFPLHAATQSSVRVHQMLTAVLEALVRDIRLDPATGNGDVLQAVAMAISIRAAMIEAPKGQTDDLARSLLDTALSALDNASRRHPQVGHA